MKISKEYGPQFDPTDGTIGELQLVKRWMVCSQTGKLFTHQQGRYTWASEQDAKEMAEEYGVSLFEKLEAVAFWCFPNHFDPVGRVPLEIQ